MKKAMFIDLDGTLLTDDHKITKLNKEAITQAIKLGWDIILTTGKSYDNSIAFYKELNLNTWFSSSQGQILSKPNEGVFEERFINFEDVKAVLKGHMDNINNIVIETTNGIYVKDPNDKSISKYIGTKLIEYNGEFLNGIIGLYVAIDKKIFIETPNMDIWKWDTGDGIKILSFKPKGVCKLSVLNELIEREKYRKTIVFGNGRNDLKSLLKADLGIAMNNSHPKVLTAVKHLTEKDNNNSGVGIEIQKILNDN